MVALLERSLTPDPEVSHVGWLTNFKAGYGRQCDVVIRYGQRPLHYATVIEVQDRNRKVEMGMVEGGGRRSGRSEPKG